VSKLVWGERLSVRGALLHSITVAVSNIIDCFFVRDSIELLFASHVSIVSSLINQNIYQFGWLIITMDIVLVHFTQHIVSQDDVFICDHVPRWTSYVCQLSFSRAGLDLSCTFLKLSCTFYYESQLKQDCLTTAESLKLLMLWYQLLISIFGLLRLFDSMLMIISCSVMDMLNHTV